MKNLGVYLSFNGNCAEAMKFYKDCFNGEVQMQTFKDSGQATPPGSENRIMHAELKADELVFMASDTMPGQPFNIGSQVSLNVMLTDENEQTEIFKKLATGGKIIMELQDTFWGARFGMLTDKYGNNWMLNVQKSS